MNEEYERDPKKLALAVRALTWEKREQFLEELGSLICMYCAGETVGCQCWNDE